MSRQDFMMGSEQQMSSLDFKDGRSTVSFSPRRKNNLLESLIFNFWRTKEIELAPIKEVSPSQSQQTTPSVTPSVERRAATKEDQIDSTATSFESESPLERSMAAASFSESSSEILSTVTDRPLRSVQSTTVLKYDSSPAMTDAPKKENAVYKTRSGSMLLQAAIAEALKKNRQSMNVQRGTEEEQIFKEKLAAESPSKKEKRRSKRESLTLPKIDFDALNNKNATISSPRRPQEADPSRSLPALFNRRSLQMSPSDGAKASPRNVSPFSARMETFVRKTSRGSRNFSVPLSQLPLSANQVPLVLEQAIDFLSKRELDLDLLLEQTKEHVGAEWDYLERTLIDKKALVDFGVLTEEDTPLVYQIVKWFITHLPESLLTNRKIEPVKEALDIDDEELIALNLQTIIATLPEQNERVLELLVGFFRHVINSLVSKMTPTLTEKQPKKEKKKLKVTKMPSTTSIQNITIVVDKICRLFSPIFFPESVVEKIDGAMTEEDSLSMSHKSTKSQKASPKSNRRSTSRRNSIANDIPPPSKRIPADLVDTYERRLLTLFCNHFDVIFRTGKRDIEFQKSDQNVNVVKHVSAERAVMLCLDQHYRKQDGNFVDVFLSTHTYYLSRVQFIERMIELYKKYNNSKYWEANFRENILERIKRWASIDMQVIIKDKKILQILRKFLTDTATKNTITTAERSILDSISVNLLTAQKSMDGAKLKRRSTVCLKPELMFNVMAFTPKAVAHQLLLLDVNMIREVKPSEFQKSAWMKRDTSPNYHKMVDKYNQISNYVAYSILEKHSSLENRVAALSFWIKVASQCVKVADFHSAWTIYCGLTVTPITRLWQTWEKLPKKYMSRYKKLKALFNMNFNFGEYRKLLATAKAKLPIPVLAIITKDILRYEEDDTANKDGLIDFDKMRGIWNTYQGFAQGQHNIYLASIKKKDDLYQLFANMALNVEESELNKMSVKCEVLASNKK